MASRLTRCFLAVEIGAELKKEGENFVGRLEPLFPGIRFIKPENWHITLHFFGEISDAAIPIISESFRAAFSEIKPFHISLSGFGTFPVRGRPRVLWIGVSGDVAQLQALKRIIDGKLCGLKIPIEKRDFKPHLTVGRAKGEVRTLGDPSKVRIRTAASCRVDALKLFKSDLSGGMARYTVLDSFSFGSA